MGRGPGPGRATPSTCPGTAWSRPESGAILGAWAAALPAEVLLFVDPGPLIADIPAAVLGPVLGRCDWWSCNQREAALLTGASDPAEAARLPGRAHRPGGRHRPGRPVGLRPGPPRVRRRRRRPDPGAMSLSLIPAPAVVAVDTTGAGDAHAGVFLAGLAAGLPPAAAASRANAAAALAVTRAGAGGIPVPGRTRRVPRPACGRSRPTP